MKVLLISFWRDTDAIGLKYIHSFLLKNGVDSHILFLTQYNENIFTRVSEFISELNPRIIGVSVMSTDFRVAKNFSEAIKTNYPDIKLVWGGIHPSIDPKSCLDYSDYVFVGEAEEAFLEFVRATIDDLPVYKIQNLVFKKSEEIITNPVRPYNEKLDLLPFPEHLPHNSYIIHNERVVALNRKLLENYARYSGKSVYIMTSRGCPFSCTYCCNSFFYKLYGKKVIRKRSVDNVIEEMKSVINQFPDIFFIDIQDDNFFSYEMAWMEEFAERYKREIKRDFVCRATPAHLTEKKIKLLKEAGLSWIFMGLQSGSSRINYDVYKRPVSIEKFFDAVHLMKKYRVPGQFDVIVDNPYEKEEDIIETIETLVRIPKPYILNELSLVFYYGTELQERAMNDGIQFEEPTKKNYLKYQPVFLNKVIRICPLIPRSWIIFIVKNRKSPLVQKICNIMYRFSTTIIEPVQWFRSLLISLRYNPVKVVKVIKIFIESGGLYRDFAASKTYE